MFPMTAIEEAGAVASAILAIVALVYGGFRVYKFADAMWRLVHHELNHNGGGSTKDAAHAAATAAGKAADYSREALALAREARDLARANQETHEADKASSDAWQLSTERELGSLHYQLRVLRERDKSAGQDQA